MTKKKKNKRKKLRSLILLLLLTIVMLSTATYAWFTANKIVSIQDINVQVATSSGIQISVDAENWKTSISNGDITTNAYSGNVNQLPSILNAVSTSGVLTSGRMNMYKGTLAAEGETLALTTVASNETQGTTGDFVAFDIFLKTEEATSVYLEPGSGVSVTTSKSDKGLQNATRYAFVVEGSGDIDEEVSTLTAYNSGSAVYIVEPNYDSHTSTGVLNASQYYNITTLNTGDGNAKVPYDGVKGVISTPIPIAETNHTDNSTYFGAVTTIATDTAYSTGTVSDPTGTYTSLLSLPAGITKIRVYMWVEGQDVDCENNASGAYVTFSIGLTTLSSDSE